MNLSYTLAEFVANTEYSDIPASVIEIQKKSIMDATAITFGAATIGDGCRQMVELAEHLAADGNAEATVIGFGKKLPAAWAAFANASMAHSLDFGDTHQRSTIHSNSSSFPAALAVAESLGNVSGKELLTALVLGSEVGARIALGADVNTTAHGFYMPTIYSSFAATAAVAKLLRLTPQQIVDAFSFNLCQSTCSSELNNNSKTVMRSVREAFTARNAIVACYMAKAGLIGFEQPLEGKLGFYHAYLQDRYTAERVVEGLGSDWEAEKLTFKAWPCCFGTHATITALRELCRTHSLTGEDIIHAQVTIGDPNPMLFEPREQRCNPESSIIGKFSIPFTAATAILKGNVDLDSFSYERLHDPEIRALASRFDYTYAKDWGRGTESHTRIVLETTKGTFERMITDPLGTPNNPMDDEAFQMKFISCARKALAPRSDDELTALQQQISSFEKMENISDFTALL